MFRYFGLAIIFIGALIYARRRQRHPLFRLMYVTCVDEKGRRLGKGEWCRTPKPDHIQRNGLAALETYMNRLVASPDPFTTLLIFTPEGNRGLGVWHVNGEVSIHFGVDRRTQPEKENAIRELYEVGQVAPIHDYLSANGGIPDATRHLAYPLSGKADQVTRSVRLALQKIEGIQDEEALEFTLEGHAQAKRSKSLSG